MKYLIGIIVMATIVSIILVKNSRKHLSAIQVNKVNKENEVEDIKNKSHKDFNATILGFSEGKVETLTDDEATGHGGVWGASGSGKTTLLMNFVESCSERSIPLFFIDGKGDIDLPNLVKSIAEKNGREFYHFSIKKEHMEKSKTYNPLRIGEDSAIRDKLINLTKWSEEHYKVNAERAIMLIVNILEQLRIETENLTEDELEDHFELRAGESIPDISRDIVNIKRLLKKDIMKLYITWIKDENIRNELDDIAEGLNVSWYEGIESRLALLAENNRIKKLLKDDSFGINLVDILKKKAIVLFSLDSLQNKSATEMLGRLIVNDINTAVSFKKDNSPAYAIYDEHGAYISEEIESQFAMARSFGLRIITSTQEISDYEKSDLGDILKKKVIGNTNFKLIMRQNDPENAEYLAEAFGTKKRLNKTMSTDKSGDFRGLSFEEVDEFVIHPNKIKKLEIGQAVLIVKSPKYRVIDDIKVRRG